jgi:hypothetical protein
MTNKSCDTFWARIYIAGPINEAKQIIRRECLREGLCVTITPTDYIYTGGEEAGYCVELVNYPRFPCDPETLYNRATDLAIMLRDETFQHSVMVMTPGLSRWYSTREQ